MANDFILPIRRACLIALKADAALTAIVPAPSIYPQTVPPTPAWPFVKMGAPTPLPLRAGMVDGSTGIFAVHGFAKVRYQTPGNVSTPMLETAEDHATRIGSAIASALDRKHLDMDGGRQVKLLWTGSQLMQDGDEADAYHCVVNYGWRAIA